MKQKMQSGKNTKPGTVCACLGISRKGEFELALQQLEILEATDSAAQIVQFIKENILHFQEEEKTKEAGQPC